jgi:hypothetical protein
MVFSSSTHRIPQPKETINQIKRRIASVWRFFFQYCSIFEGEGDMVVTVSLGLIWGLSKKANFDGRNIT